MLKVKKFRDGWAVFSCGFRITGVMNREKARQIKRHMAAGLVLAA